MRRLSGRRAASGDVGVARAAAAAASDACSDVTWSNDFDALSDDCGATGMATVTFTATDDCGSSGSDGYVHNRRHHGPAIDMPPWIRDG